MQAIAAAAVGLILILLILVVKWKWRSSKKQPLPRQSSTPVQLVHRLCPHHNVVQSFEVEQKDSLDEHLDVLTRKLAEKHTLEVCLRWVALRQGLTSVFGWDFSLPSIITEMLGDDESLRSLRFWEGRLHISKSKIRETQYEIENLHAIDNDVRTKYREIMESLKNDLLTNEKECKKLQEQIEWVSRRRAELRDEVRRGQILYGEAAAELASNLTELQRGRSIDHRVIDKPYKQSSLLSLRHRKEPALPRSSPISSLIIKGSPPRSNESFRIPERF